MVSFGMLLSMALSTASRRRGLLDASPPPSLAATVISRMSRVKILPRLASLAAFLCLMFAHLLCPAMREASLPHFARGNYSVATGFTRPRTLQHALLREELREHLETHVAVVDLE